MARIIALMLALLPAVAEAGYLSTKSEWDQLSDAQRSGYVMGAFDGIALQWVGDASAPARGDMETCSFEMGLTSASLVEIVNREYENLENWKYGPHAVLMMGLGKVCRDIYNRERVKRGEEPFKAAED